MFSKAATEQNKWKILKLEIKNQFERSILTIDFIELKSCYMFLENYAKKVLEKGMDIVSLLHPLII